jgi:hypothetical protein
VQLGAERPRQAGDSCIDDVVINAHNPVALSLWTPGRRQRRRI